MKMLLTLNNRLYKKKTRKILLRITLLRAYKCKLMRNFIQKKVTGGLFDDYDILPHEKKNYEDFL